MRRSQRKCVKQTKKFNDTSFVFNSIIVNTITIENVNADEIFFDEKKIIILNHFIKTAVFFLFVVVAKKHEPNVKKTIKNIIKNVLNKKIDKKKICLVSKHCATKNENLLRSKKIFFLI